MLRLLQRSSAFLLVLLLLPSSAQAQFAGAITGVVKDASGGVLPGVTVEAASPALIEKVRSVVTDDTGQYRIVDLRPGTYAVTSHAAGIQQRQARRHRADRLVCRHGERRELKVGALEETITVTGETPVVDVQSVKVQQTVSNDIIRAVPSSRSAGGIQALIPGMSSNGDSGGLTGGGGSAGSIHGGRGSDSRTYNDGLNIGWGGGGGGQWGNMVNVAAAQELVLSTSGGLGEAETSGVTLNAIPREGGNAFSGSFVTSGANSAMQKQLYAVAEGPGPENAVPAQRRLRDQSDGRRPDHPGQAVVPHVMRRISTNTRSPAWVNRNAGSPRTPGRWISTRANRPLRKPWIGSLTGRASWRPRRATSSISAGRSRFITRTGKAAAPQRADDRRDEPGLVRAVAHAGRDLVVAADEPVPGGGRLGRACESRYRNPAPRVDGTFNPRMMTAPRNRAAGSGPGLPDAGGVWAAASITI
jgi:hypothetical protein